MRSEHIGKETKQRKEWVTSKGAKIVFEYDTIKDESFKNDFGEKIEMIKKGVYPKYLSINGTEVSTWNTTRTPGKHELSLGRVKFQGKEAVINIEMPESISTEIYGEFPKSNSKRNPLICPNCGEFCYGDCTAN